MVADKGREVGVATPACDAVVQLVKDAGVGQLVPSEDNLVRLAEMLGIEVEEPAVVASARL